MAKMPRRKHLSSILLISLVVGAGAIRAGLRGVARADGGAPTRMLAEVPTQMAEEAERLELVNFAAKTRIPALALRACKEKGYPTPTAENTVARFEERAASHREFIDSILSDAEMKDVRIAASLGASSFAWRVPFSGHFDGVEGCRTLASKILGMERELGL